MDPSTAFQLAQAAIQRLIQKVVTPLILSDRAQTLTDARRDKISQSKIIDTRTALWCSLSGKGGQGFSHAYRNVSLMDHCLSVATGAVVFSALKLADDVDDTGEFSRLCFTVALVGLLHDLNKRAGCRELQSTAVMALLQDYWTSLNLGTLLNTHGIAMAATQMHQLLCFVESGTSFALGVPTVDAGLRYLVENYVRLADTLDSTWHRLKTTENQQKPCGIDGVLDIIKGRTDLFPAAFQQWRHIQLVSPQTPFLLDELLRALSSSCQVYAAFPPLLESHHDGRLDVLVPEKHAEAIIKEAFTALGQQLAPSVEIVMSTGKTPQIKGGAPSLSELFTVLKDNKHYIARLLPVSVADQALLANNQTLSKGAYRPAGTPATGQTFNLLVPDEDTDAYDFAVTSALVRLLLSMPGDGRRCLSQKERQHQLVDFLGTHGNYILPNKLPDKLPDCSAITGQTLLAVAAANLTAQSPECQERLSDLLYRWYEGSEDQPGLRATLASQQTTTVLQQTIDALGHLLKGKMLSAGTGGEFARQTCLVTGLPGEGRIEAADALYGIKISAFSTRRGRPARLGNAKGKTYVSPLAFIEYQLRTRDQDSPKGDYPLLLSSPTMTGLFAALRLTGEQYIKFGLFDLAREQITKGTVLTGPEIFEHRIRLARFESFPPRFTDQIAFLKRVINGVRRTGRPFHLFRGLPEPRHEIFYSDCLPSSLQKLLGQRQGFVLEELPVLYRKLEMVETVLECSHGGQTLLREMLSQTCRFGALCVAWMAIEDQIQANLKHRRHLVIRRYRSALSILEVLMSEARLKMSHSESNIIVLAQKAAELQKAVSTQSSKREQQLVFQLCFDTAKGCCANGILDRDSLIRAIEGALENKVLSHRYGGARDWRDKDALSCCEDIARFFVDNIWLGPLAGKPPAGRVKGYMLEIYRMELLHTYRARRANRIPPENDQ